MSSDWIDCIIFCFSNANIYTQHDFNPHHGAQSFGKHNFLSPNHKIFYVLSKSKVHHHMILSIPSPHSEPLESSPHFQKVFKIRFNFILPSTSRPSKWSLALSLPELCVLFSFNHLCCAVCHLILVGLISVTTFEKECKFSQVPCINPLMPNDDYSGRTATLTSKRCILYIYSTNIGTEYFKHCIYSSIFPLQNAVCFINRTYLVPVLFTFYIQDVLKLKKNNSGAKRLRHRLFRPYWNIKCIFAQGL